MACTSTTSVIPTAIAASVRGCRERFEADNGRKVADWPKECHSGPRKQEYNDWRCRQITSLVSAVSREARQLRPGLKISAAVFGAYPSCRESVAQDWPAWIKAGYLDFVCPMDYTARDAEFVSLVTSQMKLIEGRVPLYPGIGATATGMGAGAGPRRGTNPPRPGVRGRRFHDLQLRARHGRRDRARRGTRRRFAVGRPTASQSEIMSSEQRQLFETQPEPWEADDQSQQLVATVVPSAGPSQEFDYVVPDALRESVEPGRRVKAPFGPSNRLAIGYCVRLENRPAGRRRLKSLHSVLDRSSLLSPAMLRLTRWIADYYLCDWAAVLDAVVPAGVRGGAGTRMATLLSVDPEVLKQLPNISPLPPGEGTLKLAPKQLEVLRVLAAAKQPMGPGELARAARCTQAPIVALRRKGLIRVRTSRVNSPRPEEALAVREKHLVLNPDQQRALRTIIDALNSRQQQTILVHGVTGSGKTEVYIQAIQEVIHFGRQAIVLVPEISLTPQTVERFRQRFGAVAVLHSHLSDAERHWHWQQIAEGAVSVVVGARSAIFAPTPNLGLIVLDEEHETSFKQESLPRYHARDVALARAAAEEIPLVLGSATPSLESWHRAKSGQYLLVEMPRRVLERPMPAVGTIDLRAQQGPRLALQRRDQPADADGHRYGPR